MKIKLLHTQVAVMSKGHKFSFNAKDHVIEYLEHLQMFKIDETLVPISNIREVLIEEDLLPFRIKRDVEGTLQFDYESMHKDQRKWIEEPSAKKAVTTEDSLDKIDEISTEVKRRNRKPVAP